MRMNAKTVSLHKKETGMRKDLTDITLVVDRSGSMSKIRDDAEGGINTFIDDQKGADGDATLTIVQFDTEYEFVHTGKPIQDVPKYTLTPRGGTALLDAVGRAIAECGERLDKLDEANKPGCVVFVIVTDGHENSSKEFTKEKVRESITLQRETYNWQFTFLGADDSAFDEAVAMGIPISAAAAYSPDKVGTSYKTASKAVMRGRTAALKGQKVDMSYTEDERKAMS